MDGVHFTTKASKMYDSNLFKKLEDGTTSVIFMVRASEDVEVGLLTGTSDGYEMYEFVIGGQNNSETYIQTKDLGDPDDHRNIITIRSDMTETIGILNFNETREFWADVHNGWVRLGKGGIIGSNIVVEWQDPDPMVPTHVGFRSGSGAFWTFPVNGMLILLNTHLKFMNCKNYKYRRSPWLFF